MEDDPFDDDAVMDDNNENTKCDPGSFWNVEDEICEEYEDDEFNYGDDFDDDSFIEQEIDDLGKNFEPEELEEV